MRSRESRFCAHRRPLLAEQFATFDEGEQVAKVENHHLKGGQIYAITAEESHRRMIAGRANDLVAMVARSASLGGIRIADAQGQRLKGGLVDSIKADERREGE